MSSNALRPPPRPRSPERSSSTVSHRSASSMSTASNDSQANVVNVTKRSPYLAQGRTATTGAPSSSMVNLQNFSRPAPRGSIDANMKSQSSLSQASIGHRPRQHSQGFFEPSLPHASSNGLSASQIAAAAAMHHLQGAPHERKRSVQLAPINTAAPPPGKRVPSPVHSPPATLNPGSLSYSNGTLGGKLAATTAANAAFPRSPLPSPNMSSHDHPTMTAQPYHTTMPPPPIPEAKAKERSKTMKLFSKPKSIGVTRDKDFDKKNPPQPSPGKGVLRSGFANASTTSLLDSNASSAASFYSTANASTSTLTPLTLTNTATMDNREKERHRHNFLSRQKNKLKEGDKALPLSSASSNSQAVNPSAPQSLYSFAPQSPGSQSTFAKSMSGLDLRHGGRALREKKKEEKAAAASLGLTPILSNSSINVSDSHREFAGPGSLETSSFFGPASAVSTAGFNFDQNPGVSAAAFSHLGSNMGLSGITADDAWPLLKARLLNVFEGEDLKTPIEDFNLLVSVHIRRCVQRKAPVILIEDFRELLWTGFSSLSQTIRYLPDDRLVPKLVEIWNMVYGTILPFIQAVFLPLDLEFRGRGAAMTAKEAADFWGAMPEQSKNDERPSSAGGTLRLPSLPEELDVRRITLIMFRDTVMLPKNEALMVIFSRLSLDSINSTPTPAEILSSARRTHSNSNPMAPPDRPGTGGSLSPRFSSFNSQTSTLLDAASSSSGGGPLSHTASRSRATSNTSAGSFGTSLAHVPAMPSPPVGPTGASPTSAPFQTHGRSLSYSPPMPADPAQVTETVARMLQCVSVLAGVQTSDNGQATLEKLTVQLKYNWLGRGRTGRQRRGWVGMKVKAGGSGGVGVGGGNSGGQSGRTGTVGA